MSSLMGSIFKGAAATAPATSTAASTLSILRMGSPALRLASRPWSKDDIVSGTTRGLVRDMTATMHSSEGVGLAAPQVGINKQLVIVHLPADSDLPNLQPVPLMALFNPKLTVHRPQDKIAMSESCLSVPGLVGKVWRHRYVRVEYVDAEGNDRRLEASGFIAAMLQHEIDHLHAKLFIDHVKPGDLYFHDEFMQHGADDFVDEGTLHILQ